MFNLGGLIRSLVRQPAFLGFLATNFVLGLASSFVVPFMSMWGTLAIGMRPVTFGLFMTATSVSAIVLSTLLARWSDTHVARRTMLMVGATGGMVGYLGYAFVREVAALVLIGSLALGLASVSFSQLFAHAREELGRPENAGADTPLLLAMLRASFSLAWLVGPAIGAAVMLRFSYRGIFVAASGLFFLFLVGVLLFVRDRPRSADLRRSASTPLFEVLTRPVILAHFCGFVLVFAAFTINMMNLPLLVTQQLGGTARHVGIIFGVAPVLEIPLMIWFGRLAARGHQMALIRFGVGMAICYFLALRLASEPWHIYPMQLLSAASIAVTTNVSIVFFQDLLPGQTGLATSIYSNAFATGSLCGYFIFGALVNVVGHRGLFLVCAGLSATTLAMFLAYRHRQVAASFMPGT